MTPAADTVADQLWDPDRYARNARFVADLGAPVVDLAAIVPGERVLDLGCGDGALTLKLKEAGAEVVGVDASPEQIEAARGLGLDARVMDGHALEFDGEFDLVFSNATLHWLSAHPDRVIEGVFKALKPGGRFVAEMGGFGNVGTIRRALYASLEKRRVDAALHDPWYFPTIGDYTTRLERGGLLPSDATLFERPTRLPGALEDWLDTFAEPFLKALPAAAHEAIKREVAEAAEADLRREDGIWYADYVRLRFRAVKVAPGTLP